MQNKFKTTDLEHPVILPKIFNCRIQLHQVQRDTHIWLRHRLTLIMTLPLMSPSGSLHLTVRERRAIAGQMLSLLRYMVMTVILIAVDLMVFWVFELLHHQAQGEIITQGTQDEKSHHGFNACFSLLHSTNSIICHCKFNSYWHFHS